MLNGFHLFNRGKASDYSVRILCVILAILDICILIQKYLYNCSHDRE
jgi:hypothetical protein